MICTAHQANFIPGMSVIEKMLASDAVILLDEVLYSPHGWSNRNRMPDGSWLTVPVESGAGARPLNRVRISEHGRWRTRVNRTLRQHYGAAVEPLCAEIERPWRLLIGLNLALLRVLLPDSPPWSFQSHLDGGHAAVAVSEDREKLLPISERLAMMVSELGGDVYLSGPSGFRYLSEEPFHERGIEVRYFAWHGPNPCALERTRAKVERT